jgi:hypothetical protein
MDIVILLFDFHFELVRAKADPSLPTQRAKTRLVGDPASLGMTKSLGRED